MKHTQGPWKAVANVAYWEVIPLNNAGENGVPFTIADVCASAPNNRDGGLQEANARLIAAAPDLLISLKDCVDALRVHAPESWAYSQAVKLIEKLDIEQYPNSMEK